MVFDNWSLFRTTQPGPAGCEGKGEREKGEFAAPGKIYIWNRNRNFTIFAVFSTAAESPPYHKKSKASLYSDTLHRN